MLSVDLPGILGRKIDRNMYKISEESSLSRIPVDFQPCGDQIMWAFEMICMPLWGRKWSKHRHRRRHKRDVTADRFVQTKYEAQDFLSLKRRRRDTSTGPTDINEECCNERCRVEEISEYC